ncbi:MAG: A24 family peptidase [Lactobacillus sp.]|jgi:leader peptidase (prepilin peptidase)/N-methyltransferase|nr:A24 family peptidase [Lactobacillus sp.]
MIYAISGFIFGLLIPYISRRFEKFMPATGGYAIYRIVKPTKKVSTTKKKSRDKYKKLAKSYLWRSIVWGIFCGALSYLTAFNYGEVNAIWYVGFFWSLLLLAEIDYRMMLLPDRITFPLLIAGFLYAVFVGQWVGVGESAIGAAYGYIIPVFASMLFVWKNKDVFGGGDIKLLAAVGAWVGLEKLAYVIVFSTILFMIYALVKKKRGGAYGPAIAVATIAVAFCFL